jgi:hypothetical protein
MEIMSFVENGFGPRYNERTSAPSAQTERWGVSRPVSLLLGGEDLTGRLSISQGSRIRSQSLLGLPPDSR